jgi:hypothetical protein
MNATLLCTTALLLGCMGPGPAATTTSLVTGDPILPPATRTLVVPGTEEDLPTLLDLLREFADCTGQELLLDSGGQSQCDQVEIPLLAGVEMPAAEVYPFVEAILAHHQVYIAPLKGGEVPLLGIYPLAQSRRGRLTTFTLVPPEDLPGLIDHPALLVQSVILLPNTDVRQLSTSMRVMFADQNRQSLVPAGEHSLIVQGAGREVAQTARYLLIIDEAAGAAERARQAAAEKAQAPVPGPQHKR